MHEEAYHLVASRLGCERAMVGMGWATSCSGCMDRLRKHYIRKAAWSLSGYMTTDSTDYCMLVNECVWPKSQVCSLRLEVAMGSVFESELGQKCIVVLSEKNLRVQVL